MKFRSRCNQRLCLPGFERFPRPQVPDHPLSTMLREGGQETGGGQNQAGKEEKRKGGKNYEIKHSKEEQNETKYELWHGSENLTKAKRQQEAVIDQESISLNRIGRCKVRGFDPFLSPKEAAEYLGVSVRFIYERMASGELASQPIGRLRRIRQSTLEDWLIRQQNGEAI